MEFLHYLENGFVLALGLEVFSLAERDPCPDRKDVEDDETYHENTDELKHFSSPPHGLAACMPSHPFRLLALLGAPEHGR